MANPWGAILAGAGQAVIAGADYHAAKKREEILNHLLKRRQFQQGQIDDRTMQFVNQMRDSSPEAERANATAEFTAALRAARPQAAPADARGVVSDREAAELSALAPELDSYGAEEADIEADLAAPIRQRMNESLLHSRFGTDVDQMKRKINSTDYLGQLRLARARANPWMTVLGGGLKAAGGAFAGGMGGGMGWQGLKSGQTGGGSMATPVVISRKN